MIASEKSHQNLSDYNHFLFGHLHKKMRHSYAKFSDLVDFDDCIGKITSKSIRLQPIFNKKRLECPRQVAARFFLYGHPHEKMSHSHANDFWHKGELVLGIKGNQLRAFLKHFNSIAPETP